MAGRQIFISYAPPDERLVAELESHLSVLGRLEGVHVWHRGKLHAGQAIAPEVERKLQAADLILLLVSASFLASDEMANDVRVALARYQAGAARVVPVLLRPCALEGTGLEQLQFLPRLGRAVTSFEQRDEAWSEVAGELLSILRFRADPTEPIPAAPAVPIRPIGEIFRTMGMPDSTLVSPAQLPLLCVYLRLMAQGLVVEGPSGVGKTTIVKKALRDLCITNAEWLSGQDEDDRRKLDERLRARFAGHLVIDDFHRLDRTWQERVAIAMKLLADRDTRDAKITVIGVNPVGDSLVRALRDLAGRFEVITMGRQPDEKVAELISEGEKAANILFRRRDELITAAAGSFFTAQHLCFHAAVKAGIHQTAARRTTIDVGFRDVVNEVMSVLERKYHDDLRRFACHDEKVPPRGACLALLWLLGRSEGGHITLDDTHYRFADGDVRAALAWLKSSNLSSCFTANPTLLSLLHYNPGAGVLSIEDPQLAFYLRHLPWPRFIEQTAHRQARIDAEGNLVFSRRPPSDRPAREPVFHVLHLSDLHFSQLAQADVWCGQLVEDLKDLECDRVDVLVLSGDLTQKADGKEFEAARRFLLRLSNEIGLSPKQVVMVPGNHDLAWPLSEAAYSLRRRKDVPAIEEGTFIAHGTDVVEVRDEDAYKRRFSPFAEFYEQIHGTPYSLEYAEQIDLRDFPKEGLLILGLNSSWEVDHHFSSRASIHPGAVAEALRRIRLSEALASRFKIAVWHHPLSGSGEDRIRDQGVLQQLAKAGFRLLLHGHIHKADAGLYRYDMAVDGRRIDIVSAGTFGAPTRDWVPGFPLQYNLLRITPSKVIVETRRREEPNGAWAPDARWRMGRGKDPLPRYEIPLTSGGSTVPGT